jgi:hypothetical protein
MGNAAAAVIDLDAFRRRRQERQAARASDNPTGETGAVSAPVMWQVVWVPVWIFR